MGKHSLVSVDENAIQIPLTEKKRLHLEKKLYDGEEVLDMRLWCFWEEKQLWYPTKKGIFLPIHIIEEQFMPAIVKLLEPVDK